MSSSVPNEPIDVLLFRRNRDRFLDEQLRPYWGKQVAWSAKVRAWSPAATITETWTGACTLWESIPPASYWSSSITRTSATSDEFVDVALVGPTTTLVRQALLDTGANRKAGIDGIYFANRALSGSFFQP